MKNVFSLLLLLLLPAAYVTGAEWTELLSDDLKRISKPERDLTKQEGKQSRKELKKLTKLTEVALKDKVKKGDPIAGLALVQKYSQESLSLVATPMLANSAAEDAIRWYSLAAKIGARTSTSINGLSVPPVRVVRRQ